MPESSSLFVASSEFPFALFVPRPSRSAQDSSVALGAQQLQRALGGLFRPLFLSSSSTLRVSFSAGYPLSQPWASVSLCDRELSLTPRLVAPHSAIAQTCFSPVYRPQKIQYQGCCRSTDTGAPQFHRMSLKLNQVYCY